eukprot:3941107-Rhodomonas_salina.1
MARALGGVGSTANIGEGSAANIPSTAHSGGAGEQTYELLGRAHTLCKLCTAPYAMSAHGVRDVSTRCTAPHAMSAHGVPHHTLCQYRTHRPVLNHTQYQYRRSRGEAPYAMSVPDIAAPYAMPIPNCA